MICHINLAKGFRGGERQTALLVNQLEIPQKLIIRKGSPLKEYIKEGVEIVEISKPFFLYLPKLKNCSLIHAHEAKAAQLALLANLIYKIPYIITRRVIFKPKKNPFTRLLYKKAAHIIAISKVIKEVIKPLNENISIIPSAITPHKKSQTPVKERYKGKFLVVNIAALAQSDKGQLDIIEAAKMTEDGDILYLLVGSGRDEEMLKNAAKGVENIVFTGFQKDVAAYLEAADIFLFPSKNEGLGSILLDAMHFKKPIITRAVGGIPDIADESFAIFVNSPKDIKEAVQKLKNDSARREEMGEKAYEKSKKYHISALAKEVEKLYKKVLGEDTAY